MGRTIANQATPSQVSGRLATWHRVMEEAGLEYDDLEVPIDDLNFRNSLVEFWRNRGAVPAVSSTSSVPGEPERVTEAEMKAIEILGKAKVITAFQAEKTWPGRTVGEFPIRYSEDALRECAEANAKGEADWRLVYIHGVSLRRQREILGVSCKRQPCYYDNNWWLGNRDDEWALFQPESGYYLLDFKGRFGRTSWQNQEDKIAELGPELERAHETVVSEAAISFYQVSKERLLGIWYHWGRSLDSDGDRVLVGFFVSEGWFVRRCHPDWDGLGSLRVCLSRKFQN